MPIDEQGLTYAPYDVIRFGPNYDYVTATTAGQREFGAEYRDDFGSPFINTFNETFPTYGYDPSLPHTYAYLRPYDPGADDGGSAPFQRFLADIREGVGPGYERAVGLLRQAGYDDTAIRNYRINALNDAGRTDAFAFLGDQFFPAVALFGIAAGGAGLSGGFAAEGGAGAGAGGATSFAGPAVEGGELTGTAIGLNSGTTLGGAGGAGLEGTLATLSEVPSAAPAGVEAITSPLPVGATGTTYNPGLLETLRNLGATQIGNTGITVGQAAQGVSLANSAATLAQNPSAEGLGAFGGSLLGAYTGIPGLGFAGGLAGGAIDNQGGGNTGGRTVAEQQSPLYNQDGSLNYLALLPALLGLGGSGLSLVSGITASDRANQSYGQQQALYQLLLQLANQYQAQIQQYNAALPQTDATRRTQVEQDLANRQQTFGTRNTIAANLANPAQVAAGSNALYQGLTPAAQKHVLEAVQRDLASRGQSDGGAATRTVADTFARLETELQQRAIQNYLASQGSALSGFSYPPTGPYTPNPSQPLNALSSFPNAPGLSTIPNLSGGNVASSATSLAGQIGNLVRLLYPSNGSTGVDTNNRPVSGLPFDEGYREPGLDYLNGYTLDDGGFDFTSTGGDFDFADYGGLLGGI